MELWVIYELPTEVRYLVLERKTAAVPYTPRSENIQPVERNSIRLPNTPNSPAVVLGAGGQ